MKLSKSILSPGRAVRDAGPASLSSSLSRRLRTNGSIKGGQASPFFTATGKKRGCSFENTEPSSPKVTCIGQVRVKTKKKVKQQSRSLSRRRSGEVSFRKMEQANKDAVADGKPNEDGVSSRHHQQQQQMQQQRYYYYSSHGGASCQQPRGCPPHRNHRWGNFPVSICEALRTFGSEFSCLFPCKSSCFSLSERDKSVKQNRSGGNEGGCGAVFARWLVSVNDGEGGKSREIELVVGGREDVEEEEEAKVSSIRRRRHVLEDIEVKDDRIEEEAAARVSICIPPKNALLLMRCRSDPMKVATLMNKFRWDAPSHKEEDIEEIDDDEEHVVYEEKQQEIRQCAVDGRDDDDDDERPTDQEAAVTEEPNEEQDVNVEMELDEQEEELLAGTRDEAEELQEQIVVEGGGGEEEKEELESNMSSFEHLLDQQNAGEHHEDCCPIDQDMDELESSTQHLSPSTESDETEIGSSEADEVLSPQPVEKTAAEFQVAEEDAKSGSYDDDDDKNEIEQGIREVEDRQEAEPTAIQLTDSELEKNNQNQEFPSGTDESKTATVIPSALPECLLLMMCEPKLSMEVSKETWVCSTDFIRWLPERPRKTAKTTKDGVGGCHHEPVKRRLSIDSKTKRLTRVPSAVKKDTQQLHQPPRSSCSLPLTAAASTMIEQKLVNGVGYEPLVLTRCKSEPMRTASVKLLPESCFWNNAVRNLEPHSRPAVGVGAAGVGF